VDEDDDRNAVLEVRAGTGGEEAALFAMDLFNMYEKFAKLMGWKFRVIDVSIGDAGGYRDASATVSGSAVFSMMKFEVGTHRVQRVPATETQGRVHTSASTVAVLPEALEVDIPPIHPNDLRIDTYRSQGAGGQHVNTTESAVRITHLPTGLVTSCQEDRSQGANKTTAMRHMYAKLYAKRKQELHSQRTDLRNSLVGRGERNERIRTYNYNQGRITDHRVRSVQALNVVEKFYSMVDFQGLQKKNFPSSSTTIFSLAFVNRETYIDKFLQQLAIHHFLDAKLGEVDHPYNLSLFCTHTH